MTLTIVLLPVIVLIGAVIAAAIYIDSPGPIFYRSWRVGHGGDLFAMLKFRKMRREAPSHPVTLSDDERFTPLGRFLAATRLDELPQICNVLRGEMRLVGPRPELEYFVSEFAEPYEEILTVTPGITGNTQLRFVDEQQLLSGPDPEGAYREHLLPLKIQLDLDYVRGHTLSGDLAILARTLVLPVTLVRDRMRAGSGHLRMWLPAVATATMLAIVFVLASSHLA